MDKLAIERDKAFIDFVMNDNTEKLKAYAKKYGVPMPRSKRVLACGIYKAVQYCTDISEEVKGIAMQKCLKLGMNPFIDFENEVKDE